MTVTPEQEEQIRLLSDGELYHQAITFVRNQESVQNVLEIKNYGHQLNGLLEFARSWQELWRYVTKQQPRDWQGKKQAYVHFYGAVKFELEAIRKLAQLKFVPDGLAKNETRTLTDQYAGILAAEFVRHLVAEMLWRKEITK